jgi:IS30 family transposase
VDRTLSPYRVEGKLRHEWSPEQIAGWLGKNEPFSISYERIYPPIYMERDREGRLHTDLRQHQQPKRVSSNAAYKGSIPHQGSIDDRPAIVDEKTRIGDGEVDLMMGGHGGGGLLTLVDRKTRFTRMEPVLSKQADHVADVIIGALSEIKGPVHTLTMDNGNECAQQKRFAKALLAKGYFAHPYCAWERGANENTNGLLRPYFPKALTLRRSLKLTFAGWKIDSMTDPEKYWNFDRQPMSFNTVNQH